ncbi:hypothetical protein KAX75_09610 [candidate division WOR-3 bacterium]|nr:hypothetical protein [candidate division WOR-3 bacterium]
MKKHKNLFILFIIIFSILFLIPIWSVKYVPLQDWPVFMEFSYIIANFSNFSSTFAIKIVPPPYLTGFLILAGLMLLFPPLIAGKILLSIYIISFFASFYYYLRMQNPKCLFLYFFAPLLVFNYFFGKGNINFILSLPLFLFVLPITLKKINNYRGKDLLIIFFLSLILYFTHLFTYLVFLLILLILILVKKKGALLFAVSFIPLLSFIGYFLTNKAPLELSFYNSFFAKYLSIRDSFGTWTPYIDVILLAIPFIMLFFMVIKGWRKTAKEWKLIIFGLLILIIIVPVEVYTFSRIDQRILPFLFFILLLFPEGKRGFKFMYLFSSLLIVLSLVNLAMKEKAFVALQPKIERCIGVMSMVPQNKSVVSIGTKRYYIGVMNPFLHILSYSVPLNENVNISSYMMEYRPLYRKDKLPRPKMKSGLAMNREEILAHYDYFFIMEDKDSFERQIQDFTKPVYLDNEIKLFNKK